MRITWNPLESRFEGEEICVPSDIPFVRSAKWRTDGPPKWIWWCLKAGQLEALRKAKPPSGLRITPAALEKFKELKEIEDKNAAVMAELKAARKAQKKEVRLEEVDSDFVTYGGQDGESRIWSKPVVPPPPDLLCHVCRSPVYFYEMQEPPTCLDCEIFPEKA